MSSERKRPQPRPESIGALARLPLFFALQGRRAVIAGGGAAAAWKAELLSAAGAKVEVYAAEVSDDLLQVSRNSRHGDVIVHRRAWTASDLCGAALAIGDFRDDDGAAAFASDAGAAGVPVNVIDKPVFCDFSFGAIVNRSPLVVGISTDGAAPVFARAIRGKIESLLPSGFARWTATAARWRGAVQASGLSLAGRRKFWERFTARAFANPDSEPGQDGFARFVAAAMDEAGAVEHGPVTRVEVDGNDPDSLTLRAIRVLHSADVVLFDGQISQEILDFARREARKIRIGAGNRDDKINALIAEFGMQGARVVRLKCRDRFAAAQVSTPTSRPAIPPLVPHKNAMAAS
jgi:uroporphyrin-III C-methyltransferase/precorrin-2 dehydrogenase/sirohydrochlorin ferrochelatase